MYRTAAQIEDQMRFLAQWFPSYVTRFRLPETSVQGRAVHGLQVRAGGGGERRGVLVVAGAHARELMNPDAVVELAADLMVSYALGTDLEFGRRTWPAQTVKLIMESLDLWLVPCTNPDGREYVMTVDDLWRKNRRDNPGTACDGVDLNRNLDILWGVAEGSTSCSPCSDVYCGPSAFSEPETRNVRWVLDTRRIDCFVDVHSYSDLVMHPWGHAPTQTTDPTKVFTSLPTGTCVPIGDRTWREYMTPRDWQRYTTVAARVAQAMTDVNGRRYTPQTSFALYGTTGTHDDYVYGRHIARPGTRKTYGFTFETGPWTGDPRTSFHPPDPRPFKREAKSGIVALASQCVCAIEMVGSRVLGERVDVDPLRRIRDEALATTEAGRSWIALVDRAQGPAAHVLFDDEEVAREAAVVVERAAAVLENDEPLTDADVERTRALVERLGRAAPDDEDLRAAVEAVLDRLPALEGRRASEIVESLMVEAPPRREESAG